MGGAIHSWGGEEILEGFLKKVTSRKGFEGYIGVYVKWLSIFEDSEPVGKGIDIEAEPGEIPNIGRTAHQSGWARPRARSGKPLGWGMGQPVKGPRGGARPSEMGSGYLQKTK